MERTAAYLEIPQQDLQLLDGVIDMHVHQHPDIFARTFDEASFALQARVAGYRGILFKSHTASTVERMHYVRKMAPGIGVFGGIVLNHSVGGLNIEAVHTALALGAREVWMPTIHAANHIRIVGQASLPFASSAPGPKRSRRPPPGITVADGKKVVPEVTEIIDLLAGSEAILGTGHLSVPEIYAVVRLARQRGVERVLITHPEYVATNLSVEDQVELSRLGAYIEHCFYPCLPCARRYDPSLMAKAIHKVGASRCVMSSDLGQAFNPHPVEGMRQYIHVMRSCGVAARDVEIMTKVTPAELLGLDKRDEHHR